MFDHKTSDPVQLVFLESSVFSKRDRRKPKFCNLLISFDVDMSRFTLIGAEEDEMIWTFLEYRRH